MDIFGTFYGFFLNGDPTYYYWGFAALFAACGFVGAPLIIWSLLGACALVGFQASETLFYSYCAVAALFNVAPIRQIFATSIVMKLMKVIGLIPKISETERTALEAGVVWVEADLFSGSPDFKKLMHEPYPSMTKEEQDFMKGPLNNLCEMCNDWEVWSNRDLPPEVWDYIKKEKFLGMIIPKAYGGLEFSPMAQSEVVMRLSSRCLPAAITVMVPNSLGPAELLIHYGTEEQKNHLLPRLARGEEIPCFALTEPMAGSDAGSIQSHGEVFKNSDGKIMIRLNWNKRYITLAGVATILGLAFKLRDPKNLLGKGEDIGITCALIPSKTPGVVLGRRHDPMGVPFYNCPTQGKDVVIGLEHIVGGIDGVGRGWKMLMECLAAGRGVSLPAQSVGGSKLATRYVSSYANVRKQFNVAIGRFEGIEQPMAQMAGYTYLMEAMRRYTLGALEKGIKPPVVTAMVKYYATETGRKVINHAMDICGGAAISRGPRNLLAHTYIATPIGITVEGANILTRTLIIFGQGAMRAHPYAFKEVNAIEKNDLTGFDRAFWGHVGHVFKNFFRAIMLSVTRGWLTPNFHGGPVAKYYRRLSRASATFAIMADLAMASLGGLLKQKEMLTARFADVMGWMYIGTSVLRRFKAEGSRKEDLPYVHFAMNHSLLEIEKALDGIFANITVPGLTWFFRGPVRWWSNLNPLAGEITDKHIHKIASLISQPSEQRDRITEGIYMPRKTNETLARLEETFKVVKRAEAAEKKMRQAVKDGVLPKVKGVELINQAFDKHIITADEKRDLMMSDEMRYDAVQVDDYSQDDYFGHSGGGSFTKRTAKAG